MAISGDDVYHNLMDLDLLLQDIGQMGPLRVFLGSVTPDNAALRALNSEILAFTKRLQDICNGARKC